MPPSLRQRRGDQRNAEQAPGEADHAGAARSEKVRLNRPTATTAAERTVSNTPVCRCRRVSAMAPGAVNSDAVRPSKVIPPGEAHTETGL